MVWISLIVSAAWCPNYRGLRLLTGFHSFWIPPACCQFTEKGPRQQKQSLKSKTHTHSIVKTYGKAMVIKSVWHWHQHRLTNQWDRNESREMSPYVCGQLIPIRGPRLFRGGRAFTKWCWDNTTGRRMKWDGCLTTQNWLCVGQRANGRMKTIKLLEENTW